MDTAYKTTLELDKVLARAVQLCACQETKEMMQALEPAPTVEDERYDLAQTNAIMRCCPRTICFSRWPRSRCWKNKSARASSRRRKWPTPPV